MGKIDSLSGLVEALQSENRALRQNIENLLKGNTQSQNSRQSSISPSLSSSAGRRQTMNEANMSDSNEGLNDRQLEKITGISNQSLARYRLKQRSPTGEFAEKLQGWRSDGKRWFRN